MIRRALTLALVLLAPLAAPVSAAPVPTATPTPDPWAYNDPAMHLVVPHKFYPVGQRQIPLKELPQDPATVAGWVKPDKTNPETIVVQQESFDGNVDGFDGVLESQLRDQFDGPLFRNKEHLALKNGMPALFMTMTSGTGFSAMKSFMYIWADGSRGVALILTTRVGDIDVKTAKAILSDCSAVRYPNARDY